MNARVHFEDEADAEYRLAGRYYEERREHLGIEFLDAVDATIDHILEWPRAGAPVPRMPEDLPVRRRAVTRFPYHVVYVDAGTNIRILAIAHDHRKPGYWEDASNVPDSKSSNCSVRRACQPNVSASAAVAPVPWVLR